MEWPQGKGEELASAQRYAAQRNKDETYLDRPVGYHESDAAKLPTQKQPHTQHRRTVIFLDYEDTRDFEKCANERVSEITLTTKNADYQRQYVHMTTERIAVKID